MRRLGKNISGVGFGDPVEDASIAAVAGVAVEEIQHLRASHGVIADSDILNLRVWT